MPLNYFYDGQIRRYVEQLQRVFSNFEIFLGKDKNGMESFYRVPCVYGDSDRMAQHIIRQNSENALLPVPFFAVWENDIIPDPERRQIPNFVSKKQVIERKFDVDTNQYSADDGFRYTVERFMPIPYRMTVMADLWYTQTEHKLQVAEQVMMLFNDDLDIQTNTNPLDWSALTILKMTNIVWNGRGVPAGIDETIRTTSFQFEVPIWVNPPAKVKQQKLIQQIVMDIHDSGSTNISDTVSSIQNSFEGILNINDDNFDAIFDGGQDARIVITPGFHYISVSGNEVSLLGPDQSNIDPDTNAPWLWTDLLREYGELKDDVSMMRLRPVDDIDQTDFDFIGRLRTHPSDGNKLIWSVDLETVPSDTLLPIDAIIDPTKNIPGEDLPIATNGTRYLIFDDIPSPTQGWGTFSASINDIIEFDGASWSVSFDASAETNTQHTTNNFSGKKLKFDPDEGWIIIPDAVWAPGFWRLVL